MEENVGEFGEWPWICQIFASQILAISKSLMWQLLIALVLEYAKVNFELLQVCTGNTRWRTTCSTWHISFFMSVQPVDLSIERVSPQTYIHDTLVCTIEFNKNKYIFCCLQDFWYRKPQRKHSLCFTQYISKIRIFTLKIAKCIYTVNLPKFPSIRYIQ